MNDELWAEIPESYGSYQVSSHGRVRSMSRTVTRRNRWGGVNNHRVRERILKQGYQASGHRFVMMHLSDGLELQSRVHRLVMLAFGPLKPFDDAMVLHTDGDPTNNHISNLRWGTQKENMADAIAHGVKMGGHRPKGSTAATGFAI